MAELTKASEAIAAMAGAFRFGPERRPLLRKSRAEVTAKWITWTTPFASAGLSQHVRAAEAAGARGVFLRAEGRGTVVGCLNPEHRE